MVAIAADDAKDHFCKVPVHISWFGYWLSDVSCPMTVNDQPPSGNWLKSF